MDGAGWCQIPPYTEAATDRLRSVLADHLKCEQLTARRRLLTSLLALLSAPVWLAAMWPQLLAGPDRRFLLYLFGFLLVLSSWAVIEEWRTAVRLRRILAVGTATADGTGLDARPVVGGARQGRERGVVPSHFGRSRQP